MKNAYWSIGVLECWSVGVLERRHHTITPILRHSNTPILHFFWLVPKLMLGNVFLASSRLSSGVLKAGAPETEFPSRSLGIVFASSGGTVYGNPLTLPIPETHPTDPKCAYGITKLMVEKYLDLFHTLHGLEYVALRLGNPFGERQRIDWVQGAVAVFLGRVLRNRPISIWGDGSVARDYFHISDLVSAFVRVVEQDTKSRIYNIAGGRALSLNELLSVIRAVTGKTPRVEYTAARKLDVPANCLDISLARKELDWWPKVDISEGIGRTWEWLRKKKGYGKRKKLVS